MERATSFEQLSGLLGLVINTFCPIALILGLLQQPLALLYFLILSRNFTIGLRVFVKEPPSRIRFPPKLLLKL